MILNRLFGKRNKAEDNVTTLAEVSDTITTVDDTARTVLKSCVEQLHEVGSTIESLAEGTVASSEVINEINTDVKDMHGFIKKLDDVLAQVGNTSSQLNILALNTAIEAAHNNMPSIQVVANEMKSMSHTFNEFKIELKRLSDKVDTRMGSISSRMEDSNKKIADDSSSLEELTASTEELVASLSEVTENY